MSHRPSFYAKSAMNRKQIAVKEAIGCDGLEYQLIPSDFTQDYRNLIGRAEKEFIVENHPASSVHPPLSLSNAEDILVPSDKCVLEESMRIAQMSAEVRNDRCLTVVHVSQPPSLTDRRALDDMRRELERLLAMFPDVDIVFENITPFRDLGVGLTEFCNGYYDANVRMAQRFDMDGRVKTCLDICHAQLCAPYLDAIGKIWNPVDGLPFDYDLAAYFSMNAKLIGLIHLATFKGCGYTTEYGEHGSGFNHETGEGMATLKEVFDLYEKHSLSCPITVEVREDDYMISNIYAMSKAAIDYELEQRCHLVSR